MRPRRDLGDHAAVTPVNRDLGRGFVVAQADNIRRAAFRILQNCDGSLVTAGFDAQNP
jgi:hypothetical protein